MPDHLGCRSHDVSRNIKMWRALADRWDKQRRHPARDREAHNQCSEQPCVATVARGQSARDRAQKDGDEGRAFHQRVAGRQLLAPQIIRENTEFDRTKKCRENAEPE